MPPGDQVQKFVTAFVNVVHRSLSAARDADQIVSASRQIRSALHTFACSVADIAPIDNNEEIDNLIDAVTEIKSRWHVAEIYMLNTTGNFYFDAVDWLQVTVAELLPIVFEERYDAFTMHKAPELMDYDGFDYWSTIFTLLLRGQLQEAKDCLELHSDIAAMAYSSGETERTLLIDIFDTYPVDRENLRVYAGQLLRWQSALADIRAAPLRIFSKIPELEIVLALLSGDVKEAARYATNWREVALCQVLYNRHPLKLNHASLRETLLSAMQALPTQQERCGICIAIYIICSSEVASEAVLRDVLQNKIGSLFREYYEMSRCDGPTSYLSALAASRMPLNLIAAAQSTVALLATYLFSVMYESRQVSEGGSSLGHVLDELAVEVAMKLFELGFNDQIIMDYVWPCDVGLECIKLVLSRRVVHSDRDADSLAHAFTTAGLVPQAKSVLLARAEYWAQFRSDNRYLYAPKALLFYLKAGSSSHSKMLLEYSLHQCLESILSSLLSNTAYVTSHPCEVSMNVALLEAEGLLGAIACSTDVALCGVELVECLRNIVAASRLLTPEDANESHYSQAVQYLLKSLHAHHVPVRFVRPVIAVVLWCSEQCAATEHSLTVLSREDVNIMLQLVNTNEILSRNNFNQGYQDLTSCIRATELIQALMSSLMMSLCNVVEQEEKLGRSLHVDMDVNSGINDTALDFLSVI